jgi:hypothetical protein
MKRGVDGPRIGGLMTLGWLRSERIHTTRKQVRRVLKQIEPEALAARATRTIKRREYNVAFPNSPWHIDGHHKLIRWKFVIHAGMDGKSHVITFIDVSDNNRADTVRHLFLEGTQTWGWPQRVRSDHGGENLGVCEEMEQARGEATYLSNNLICADSILCTTQVKEGDPLSLENQRKISG